MRTDSAKIARRTLGTLQPSANDQAILVGSGGKVAIDKRKVDTKRRRLNFDLENKPPADDSSIEAKSELAMKESSSDVKVFVDSTTSVVSHDTYELVLKDDATLEYWKQLAEERRLALEKSLEENQKLHENLEILQAENQYLQKMADHCVELSEIVKTLTENEPDDIAESD